MRTVRICNRITTYRWRLLLQYVNQEIGPENQLVRLNAGVCVTPVLPKGPGPEISGAPATARDRWTPPSAKARAMPSAGSPRQLHRVQNASKAWGSSRAQGGARFDPE